VKSSITVPFIGKQDELSEHLAEIVRYLKNFLFGVFITGCPPFTTTVNPVTYVLSLLFKCSFLVITDDTSSFNFSDDHMAKGRLIKRQFYEIDIFHYLNKQFLFNCTTRGDISFADLLKASK